MLTRDLEDMRYRDHLSALRERYGDLDYIPLMEAAKYLCCDHRTLLRIKGFPISKIGRTRKVSIVSLARYEARAEN